MTSPHFLAYLGRETEMLIIALQGGLISIRSSPISRSSDMPDPAKENSYFNNQD
jgi:hypothetical protein